MEVLPSTLPSVSKGVSSEDDKMVLEEGMEFPHPPEVCLVSFIQAIMNVLIGNSRGALKPNFQGHIRDLLQEHDPAIFVVMEIKIGGDRAEAITDQLPMDEAIHTETIGYSGSLWLLWNSNKVKVGALAKTEQEIHAKVKVRSSNLSWIFSDIYASPRSE